MLARQIDLEVISNNLANLNTVGFKQDTTVFKDFPSILAHRLHDNHFETPLHVHDLAPPVGTIGTGVQVDDIVTTHDISPSLIHTGNALDLAIESIPGVKSSYAFFEVMTPSGKMYTRAGDFTIDSDGYLVTSGGSYVLGEQGKLRIDAQNAQFQPDGTILTNPEYNGQGTNLWEAPSPLDKLRLVSFENLPGLEKVGHTLYRATAESGDPQTLLYGVRVHSGMLESSNVNIVREMVDMIKAQRSYEAAAKVVSTHDQLLGQAVNDVGRVG